VRALTPNGISVVVGFTNVGMLFQHMLVARLASQGRKIGTMLAKINQPDMAVLKELMESGKLAPFVDRVFSFSEVAEAYRYMETKHARGKVVVRIT